MKAKTLLLSGFLLVVSTAAAQSLGELARRQRERLNKEAPKPAKVYTNENMPVAPRQEGPTAAGGMSESASRPASGAASTQPPAVPPAAESNPPEKPEDKIQTREYWQGRFGPARAALAKVEEERQLVDDEMQLLEIQQAREIAPDVQAEAARKITAKKAELEAKRTATEKAQKTLDQVEKDFKESGAPQEWSKPE